MPNLRHKKLVERGRDRGKERRKQCECNLFIRCFFCMMSKLRKLNISVYWMTSLCLVALPCIRGLRNHQKPLWNWPNHENVITAQKSCVCVDTWLRSTHKVPEIKEIFSVTHRSTHTPYRSAHTETFSICVDTYQFRSTHVSIFAPWIFLSSRGRHITCIGKNVL